MTATATLEQAGTTTTASTTSTASTAGPVRRHVTVETALGALTLVADADTVVGVYFAEHRPEPDRSTFGSEVTLEEDAVLHLTAEQLVAYAAGERRGFDLALRPVGSERARRVWELVAAVPRGETTTYAALGRAVGVGPRAAGQFVARNPLCVLIPCHRVVASDGRLTGYAGGVERKRLLLELEGALAPGATVVGRSAPPQDEVGEAGPAPAPSAPAAPAVTG